MSGLSWFRLTVADGKVQACERVDDAARDGNGVVYVRAASATDALRRASAFVARERRGHWLRAGLCTRCGGARDTGGLSCLRCIARMEAAYKRRAARAQGKVVPVPNRWDTVRFGVLTEVRAAWAKSKSIDEFARWLKREIDAARGKAVA